MTERINGQGFRPVDTAPTRRSGTAKQADGGGDAGSSGVGASSGVAASSGDTVNLTTSGILLAKLEEVVHKAPIVDAGRVRAIKDALAAGSYQVDDAAVADNMIRLERELLA